MVSGYDVRKMWRGWTLVFFIAVTVWAEDARLSQIRAILEPMRGRPYDESGLRGATPAFTTVKHLLRDWIESKLAGLRADDDPVAVAGPLNAELETAGLIGKEPDEPGNALGLPPGYLKEIEIKHANAVIVTAGLSIQNCGFDESAYAYEFSSDRWQGVWENEQNDYAGKKYLPQQLMGVYVSPPNYDSGADPSERLVLTLGWHDWCTSSWQDVYYRVWRIKSSLTQPKLLINESEWSFLAREPPIKGSVGFNDVLVEYTVPGRDHSREEIRHYRIGPEDKVTRVDPLALSPFDFVEEWRIRPWAASLAWTESSVREKLVPVHKRLGSELLLRPYMATTHCTDRPDLWQVSADASTYFLVRWKPPYRFTMVDVSDHRWKACDELDPHADEFRTLFPDQDWR